MRWSQAGLIVLASALLGLCGCDGRDDSLTGVWTGGFRDSLGGLGGGNLTFAGSSASVVQGSWHVFFQYAGAGAKLNKDGPLNGTIDGSSIAAVMTWSAQPSCSFSLQATRAGVRLTGTYSSLDCAVPESGTFDLEKE